MVGKSKAIRQVFDTIDSISSSAKATVLIQGESGTGKELVAKAIHLSSPRCDQKFMEVNCAALAETLLDAELFGYEKGAFTGASPGGRIGLFEAADGGTLFLDEIGEMGVPLQAKLLRVLQEKRFKRVGGVEDISVDVRVIASTNRDLTEEVEKGNFRSDLYYRLQVIPVHIPPLRERKEDISLLAEHFLCEFNADMGKEISGISRDAIDLLQTHDWPGNVRELRNVMERAVILERGEKISGDSVLIGPGQRPTKRGVQLELDDCNVANMERRLIEKVLDDMMWRRSAAARALGISRATLYNKIKQYELAPKAP